MAKQLSKRQKQVGEMIRRNLSVILQQEGTYIFGTEPLVTVTNVFVSPDLLSAKVYLSIFNTENNELVLMAMEKNQRRIQQGLYQRIAKQIRRVPSLSFYEDDTLDEMYKVDGLFKKLEEDNQMGRSKEDNDE